ncbi:MAG: hypothetical protein M1826_005040 [Phylliscum demangeonii]|nr:MAG: hypothetical protein M1826_005040 [Phylliscum demangeonii]
MTAASANDVSESWAQSHSVGRATGSIFASAVSERLQMEDSPAKSVADDTISYWQFYQEVKAKLLLVDKHGENHDIRFSAQNDDWEMEYHKRTGIPVSAFKKRLASLRTIPSTDRKRHPYGDRTSEEQLRAWGQGLDEAAIRRCDNPGNLLGHLRKRRHGGAEQSTELALRERAMRYLASRPGLDSLSPNLEMHWLARQCIQGKCTRSELERLAPWLDYREKAANFARTLIHVMDLAPFMPDWEWDSEEWRAEPGNRRLIGAPNSVARRIIDAKLIPRPGIKEGHFFIKPVYYLSAALYAKELSDEQIDAKIDLAQRCISLCAEFISCKANENTGYDNQVKLARDRYAQAVLRGGKVTAD